MKKKDPLDTAVQRAATATNLFSLAHTELDESNTILDDTVANHATEIQRLNERVAFATKQKATNAKVQEKLKDFIPE